MGITAYKIDRIDAKVDKRDAENIDVKENFSFSDVTKKNSNMLDVKWAFKADYVDIGKIDLEGTLTYFTESLADKCEEKEEKGKKTIALKGEGLREVSNFILRRGLIEATILAKSLQLPAPLQLPSVSLGEKQ